jgi:hypothetical protein
LITCWDGSCAESATDCPEATCSDTPCSLYLNTYTCPQIEEIYGYDCSHVIGQDPSSSHIEQS